MHILKCLSARELHGNGDDAVIPRIFPVNVAVGME